MVVEVRLYPMIGNAAKVSRLVVTFAVDGSVDWIRANDAFTSPSVWNISTFQLKNRLTSAEPRLVTERTLSRPGTVLTASSMGRVTMTSIWSIGATLLSTPITMRGKSVDGKTATGMVKARYKPMATSATMTKIMGVESFSVQWPATRPAAVVVVCDSSMVAGPRALDLHFGFVFQAEAADRDHLLALRQAFRDLHLVAFPHPGLNLFLMRQRIGANHHDLLAALVRRKQRGRGNDNGGLDRFGADRDAGRDARLDALARIGRLHPDFHRGRIRIDRRTDHRHLAGDIAAGRRDHSRLPDANPGSVGDGDIRARDYLRDIHDGNQWRAAGWHFAGVDGPVGDNAIDRAADFRVGELRDRIPIMCLGRFELRLRALDLLLAPHPLQRFQMFLRRIELALRLDHGTLGVIGRLLRHRSLADQSLAAFKYLSRRLQRLTRGLSVGLRFGQIFRHRRRGRGLKSGCSLVVQTLAFLRRRFQITIFQQGESISLLHVIAAVDVELAHRRADFGHDVGLIDRIQNRRRLDHALYGIALRLDHLDRSRRFDGIASLFPPAAT